MAENKIKKAVIREDLVSITLDFREAVILNQFIYWSEKVSDMDILIAKENEIAQKNGEKEREPFCGWIYKTADELAEEVMLGLSASQIRKYINNLVNYGYITKRNNPRYKQDRTVQYKVNFVNIEKALKRRGMEEKDMNHAVLETEETKGIVFISNAHKKFYCEKLKEVREQDEYHKALVYCLGISNDTRIHINKIYDFKTGCVKAECLHEGWQTSGSAKVVRMAFNLYCNSMPSVSDDDSVEEQMQECKRYTAEELFSCAYAPYFWQAVQIRYPECAAYDHELYAMLGGQD